MYCAQCKKPVADQYVACPGCGSEQLEAGAPPQPAKRGEGEQAVKAKDGAGPEPVENPSPGPGGGPQEPGKPPVANGDNETPKPAEGAATKAPQPPQPVVTPPRESDNPKKEEGANEGSKIGQRVDAANAKIGNFNNHVHNHFNSAADGRHRLSLVEFLADLPDLPPSDRDMAEFVREEVSPWLGLLRTERMLIINCGDPNLSRAAVTVLIEQLDIPPQRRKVLNFERLPDSHSPSISQLMTGSLDSKGDVVIVADAAGVERAQPFVDSLFRAEGNWTKSDRTKALKDAGICLICETEPERIPRTASTVAIARWDVSYLRFLLRRRFPDTYLDLERNITQQREHGGWSSIPADFYKQISALSNAELLDAVARGGAATGLNDGDELLQADHPLHLAAMYTATFYPNLSPNEFNQVLTKLLGQQTTLVTETATQKLKDGSLQQIERKQTRKLVDLWRERSDAILRESGLITGRDGKRSITFADVNRREWLRNHFQQFYGVYLHQQFSAVHQHNLLFDGSEQMAQDVIALTVEAARNYPDEFDGEWLSDIVIRACGRAENDTRPSTKTYQRIVDLLRTFLDDSDLTRHVSVFFARMLDKGEHHFTLGILKKLRFAPGFDVFYWLRQLLERGPEDVRDAVDEYLGREIRQTGQAYTLLQVLASWLPLPDLDPNEYQPKHKIALFRIADYCAEVTFTFDRRLAGSWPSRFPLLAVDANTAEQNFDLIVRALVHPGTTAAIQTIFTRLDVEADRLLALLFAEWVWVLRAPSSAGDGKETEPTSIATLSRDGAFDLLVRKIVEATSAPETRARQQPMLDYWDELRHYLTIAPTMTAGDRANRHEFAWKRDAIRALIARFREVQRALRPATRVHRATA